MHTGRTVRTDGEAEVIHRTDAERDRLHDGRSCPKPRVACSCSELSKGGCAQWRTRLSGESPKFGWLPAGICGGGKMVGPELQDDYLRFLQTLMPHVATVNFTWGN